MNSLKPLSRSLFSAEIIELGVRCCRPQTQHFDRKDRSIFCIIFQGRFAALTKVLMDFQSVLTAVFGDYYTGEELTQWYLTWGSKGRRVIQTFSLFFPLWWLNVTFQTEWKPLCDTLCQQTSHYLKDIWGSLLNYTSPGNWLDLEFIFTEKYRWTIFKSFIYLGENKPFHWEQEEDNFPHWIVVQLRTDEEFFKVQLQKHSEGCTVTIIVDHQQQIEFNTT